LKDALAQYNAVKEIYPGQDFWQWAATNAPLLISAKAEVEAAQTELFQAMQAYYGPESDLGGYVVKISTAQSLNDVPG
jgi:hypothetical protein